MNYIGIDLGTSSVKGLLLSDALEVLCTYSLDYPNFVDSNGWSEQDPEDWYRQSKLVIKHLVEQSTDKVASISFSGQMHGLVTLDENDDIIRNAILWNDQRTVKECEYLNEEIGIDKLTKWTGNIALTGYTAPKLLWMKNNEPDNFKRICKIMLPKDYLSYRLSNSFATDLSDASGTLYLDVANKCWSKEMLEVLSITEKQLPKLYNSYEVVGKLTEDNKRVLGIDYDIDIVIGGGDQAVGAIGTGTVNPGDINVSLGTSGVVFAPQEKYNFDSAGTLHSFCDATGKYHKMGVALNSGGSMEWWSSKIIEDQNFAELELKMNNIGANEQIYYLPYLIGERSPINDSYVRGAFVGLSLHHDKAAMTRSVMEGVAFSLKQMADGMDLNSDANIKITGGGAKNKLWVQIISDVFNMPIKTINATEGPAFGAAMLAMAGSTKKPIEEISSNSVEVLETITPTVNSKVYEEKYQKWLTLYPLIKQF